MTTYQKLVEQITAELDFEHRAIQSHSALYRALQRFTGKTINKRLLGYYKEVAPFEVKSVDFDFIAGLHYFVVVDALGNRFRHFIGYARDWSECDPGTLALRDSCYGEAEIRRNNERYELLKDPHHLRVLAKAIDQHNAAFRHVAALTDHGIIGAPARYIAARMLEGTEDFRRDQDEARAARRNG
jgi:hypothetical protein